MNPILKIHKHISLIGSSLDLDRSLKIASKVLCDLYKCQYSSFFLVDDLNQERMKHVYSSGIQKPVFFCDINDLHFGRMVIEQKKPLEVTDISKKSYQSKYTDQAKRFFANKNIKYFIYIPILRNKEVLGVICLYRDQKLDLSINKESLKVILDEIAISLENAKLHEKLMMKKERWRTIFNEASDGMFTIDNELKICDTNKSFQKIIGYKHTYLKGKNILDFLVKDEDRVSLENELTKGLFSEPTKLTRKLLLETKQGIIWVQLKFNFVHSIFLPQAIATIEDITDKKELEEEKNEFISIASHELRSPLTAMKGFLSLLQKKEVGKLNEKQEFFVKRALESTDRMINLVEGILDASRINVGKINLLLEPINLKNVFQAVKRDNENRLKEKNLKLKVSGQKTIFIEGDKNRLYQVFNNILDNAIKYSFPNSCIKINFAVADKSVIFSCTDNGVGIKPIEQKKLFTKFSRLNNVFSISTGGTGLGLYIVKNLVLAHKGKIWVESKENKGTTFFIELPLAEQLTLIK